MAIDTTGGLQDEGASEARASDMANLSDAELLEELNLAELASEGSNTGEEAVSSDVEEVEEEVEVEDSEGELGSEAEAPDDAEAGEAGEGEGGETEGETRQLATEFSLKQGDAEVEIPSDVTVTFTADGEERELPLDKVVRLAQMGFYNEARANEIREFREALPQIEAEVEEMQSELQMYRDGWRRVLEGDDDFLDAERDAFLRAQSPEARAERAERELQALRQGQGNNQQAEQARQFAASLAPEFESITTESPEVTFEEVIGRFNMLTAPLMVRGQIPASRFREVDRIVRSDLRSWAEAQNAKRVAARSTQTQQVKSAQSKVTAAKRQVARAVLPRGTQTGGAQQQAPRKYESASDVADDIGNIVAEGLKPRR